jgi:hypothetical protein
VNISSIVEFFINEILSGCAGMNSFIFLWLKFFQGVEIFLLNGIFGCGFW